MKPKTQITITLPDSLLEKLKDAQLHLKNDLQPGERVPSIEELIIDAVAESYGEEDGRVL